MSNNPYEYDNPYAEEQGNPYTQDETNINGITNTQINNNAADNNNTYELSQTNDINLFFTKIQDIKDDLNDYNGLIDRLEKLQFDLLSAVGNQEVEILKKQIENTSFNLSDLQSNTIKPKLTELYKLCGGDTDKQEQAKNINQSFRNSMEKLAKIEDNYQLKNKSKAIDQFKIVNPDSTDEEALDFINNSSSANGETSQQIFDNALKYSNRKGEAMNVLQEVQARHMEMERTERLAAELTQLFNDLQELVFEQDIHFDEIQENVQVAQKDLEKADANVVKARDHAKKGRRLRWIIFWCIVILICIIVAAVVGGVVGSRNN
ncbi:hypothetical protein BVG19_g409 [[Candida] boidinii]|nr:hypothetical protein BVG19_g409 [[Candida] boidinii]OWB50202.1 hypothetical protein B5S27_g1750 [[Candida] boidinii]OWB66816.1 hypothetical protein B5S30_g2162 [[Candida] boidinii]GMG25715.1 unnamed protein product [[Candida] boidinii]